MFSAILGGSGRRILIEAAGELTANGAALAERWRREFRSARGLSVRSQYAIERLFLGEALLALAAGDFDSYFEQVDYTARRLAKLRVPLTRATEGVLLFTRLAEPYLQARFGAHADEVLAAFDSFHHAISVAIAHQYDAVHRRAVETLLGVLDVELESVSLDDLLEKLLAVAARAFGAKWAAILLLDEGRPDCGRLRHSAIHGIERGELLEDAPPGVFFRKVLCQARPGLLLDAANDPRIAQPYFRTHEIRSVWAVPLLSKTRSGSAVGVLHVDFDRVYEFLPQELDLLTAFAERSSLAIERAQLVESVRASERRVRGLSRRILRAQEEERGRISRDLHDETGQAVLVIRLYLEMALKQLDGHAARQPVADALATADRTVAGLRRIIARLSPLVLDELGLAAALQREIRQFSRTHGLQAELVFRLPRQQRLPRELETVIYRLVQESLNNIAKHAQARHVQVRVSRHNGAIAVRVQDDGRGLTAGVVGQLPQGGQPIPGARPAGGRESFGLAGMRERLQLIGGNLQIDSAPGQGTSLTMHLPVVN